MKRKPNDKMGKLKTDLLKQGKLALLYCLIDSIQSIYSNWCLQFVFVEYYKYEFVFSVKA